jgi:hypothetical protein
MLTLETLDPHSPPLPPAPDAAAISASLMDKLPVEILTKIIDRKSHRKPLPSRVFPAPLGLLLHKETKERPALILVSIL